VKEPTASSAQIRIQANKNIRTNVSLLGIGMPQPHQRPWAAGPGEILRHALSLLDMDSDSNRRLAMLSIDNSVELMVKTYLGLPKRVTGIDLSRNKLQEITDSFPSMIKALETHASNKLNGVDLGEIEWFHTLRNELYHQGNGLTVDREKVEVYAELAKLLFSNLFENDLVVEKSQGTESLALFMATWAKLEQAANAASGGREVRTTKDIYDALSQKMALDPSERAEFDMLRKIRNEVVHGRTDYKQALTSDVLSRLTNLSERIEVSSRYGPKRQVTSPNKTLATLSIPRHIIDGVLGRRDRLSNWDILIILLYYSHDGLTNTEARSVSEELGQHITYDWFDTEFHRKQNSELVIARPIPSSNQKRYFLSELGKKRASELIHDITKKIK
jgi:uncharacterized protein YutE (UPF0331/DUF86 family)